MTRWSPQEFFDQVFRHRLADVKVSILCRVLSFDKAKGTVDVQPLYRSKVGETETPYARLSGIPVSGYYGGGYFVRTPYAAGDIVQLLIPAHEIADALKGLESTESAELHGLANATVVGGLAKKGSEPDDWSEDGLLIGHEDGNSLLQVLDDKINMVFSPTNKIEFGPPDGIKVTLDGIVYNWKHKHPSAPPGPISDQNPAV